MHRDEIVCTLTFTGLLDTAAMRSCLNVDLDSDNLQICSQFADFKFQGWSLEDAVSASTDAISAVACMSGGNSAQPVALPKLDMNTEYNGDGSDDDGFENMNFDDSFDNGQQTTHANTAPRFQNGAMV